VRRRIDVGRGLVLDVCTGGLVIIRSVCLDRAGVVGGDSIPVLPEDLEALQIALIEVARDPEVRSLARALRDAGDGSR